MSEPLTILEQAKEYLLEFKAELAAKKMQEFEVLIASRQIDTEDVAACSQALHAIRALAAAAREGVAAARQEIEQIVALSRKLDTYDRQGNRVGNQVNQNLDPRF